MSKVIEYRPWDYKPVVSYMRVVNKHINNAEGSMAHTFCVAFTKDGERLVVNWQNVKL